MKIYKHEYSRGSGKIKTYEYEAEEKTKIYIVGNGQIISKDIIGKLKGSYFKDMWTFSPDTTECIKQLIESNAEHIERVKRDLQILEEERTNLEAELKKKCTEEGK